MKAYELSVRVTREGKLDIPDALLEELPHDKTVKLIILVDEPGRSDDEQAWSRLTSEQFLGGYDEADSVYDKVN